MFFGRHKLFKIHELREFEKETILINCIFHFMKKRKFLTKEMSDNINSITEEFNLLLSSYSQEHEIVKKITFPSIKEELSDFQQKLMGCHVTLLEMEKTKK